MAEMKNLVILERGEWSPDNVIIHQIVDQSNIRLLTADEKAIENSWQDVLAKNPDAFPGPTIRLAGRHHLDNNLILEVLSSDYREGSVLGWLSVAMVPVTSDNYIALQGPVASVAATIGGGIRVPGCTPENTKVIPHIIGEVRDEFNVGVKRDDLTILGLIEIRPPIAKLHHGLVVKVGLKETSEQLVRCWERAKDRWEGTLNFLQIKKEDWIDFVELEDLGGEQAFNHQSLLVLAMVIESERISTKYVEEWSQKFGLW